MGKLTEKVTKGFFWVLFEKCGIQFAHFLVTLVLARLLTPNDYGTVALLSIFISIANVFVDCGFGKALVQKKDATQTDYNTVFYLSMAFAAVLYAALFFASPWIADFYSVPELAPMMRILALSLIFHSVNGVQNVELNRKMLFHLSFRISWVSTSVKAVVGIVMAYLGYGPWALVWASLSSGICGVIARQFVIAWRPTLTFSWTSARQLFDFGWKMMVSTLVNQIYLDLQGLLIGKFYTRADLAFVNKGKHVPSLLSNITTDSLRRVAFPALAKLQDDPCKMRNAMRRMIRCSTFCVFPAMVMLCILAEPFVTMLYGERWLPAVPFLQVFCFSVALRQFDVINLQGIMARGQSGTVMKLMIIRRLICLVLMASTLHLGVFTFFWITTLVVVPIGLVMNAIPNIRSLGYTVRMQVGDVFESFLLATLMAIVLLATVPLPFDAMVKLPFQISLGGITYLGAALVFKATPVAEIRKAVEPVLKMKFGGRADA